MQETMNRIFAFCVLSLVLAACSLATVTLSNNSRQELIDHFFEQPLKEQIASFPRYEFEDQYSIYIYGNQVRHPPAIYLAEPFAQKGESIVKGLSSHLERADDDLTVRDIVLVFAEMNRQGTYSVRKNMPLMQLIVKSVAKMKDLGWKATSEKELAAIKS